jgi:uncharacterized membrane protein YjjP (DUF1212 family)
VIEASDDDLPALQAFLVRLGATMNTVGEPVHSVQDRLTNVARAYGASDAQISAFPTYMMVSMGRGEPTALEITLSGDVSLRLDQISALDQLVHDAERRAVRPSDGLRRLDDIHDMRPRFRPVVQILGYSVLTLGICLILHPAPRDVAGAAFFGAVVGLLRAFARTRPSLQILMPIIAAFVVSALSALALKDDLAGPGLRALVASLVVFLPGAALTTAVLELAAGQMVSGSARLVSGVVTLALLAFGILAGIQIVDVPPELVFLDADDLLGSWAPWVGVLVFAFGVTLAYSAPPKSFPALLVVLYAAWVGQVLGNAIFGGYVSAFVGALVMTPVAFWVSRLPSAMPQYASFLPGFWLLVPGALGLIGVTEVVGDPQSAGAQDLVATIVAIFAVALGVLCGTLLLAGATATGRIINAAATPGATSVVQVRRLIPRPFRRRRSDPPAE